MSESKNVIVFLVAALFVVSIFSTWMVLTGAYHPPVRNPGEGVATGKVIVNIGPQKSDVRGGVVSVNVIDGGNST